MITIEMRTDRFFSDPLWALKDIQEELEAFMQNMGEAEYVGSMCLRCMGYMSKVLGASRRYLWAELPYGFHLKDREAGTIYGYKNYL